MNEYAYVRNNPINYVDPDGRNPLMAAVGFIGGIGTATFGAMALGLVGLGVAVYQESAAIGCLIEGNFEAAGIHGSNATLAATSLGLASGLMLAQEISTVTAAKDINSKQTNTATGKTDPETSGVANAASKPKETTPNTPSTITPGQAITSAEQVPENVRKAMPQSWGSGKVSRNGEGWRWQDTNSQADVRFGTGNPNSPYPNSQNPYIKINNANGQPLDKNGNLVVGYNRPSTAPEAHIPLNEFNPSNFSFLNQ